MTQDGTIIGTPQYMSPEQARAVKGLTKATDIYSLGAILYALLTGRPPFQADTPLDTLLQVLDQEPEPPSKLNPDVPRALEEICLKCLQKDPKYRYTSAAELAQALGQWQPAPEPQPPKRRRRALVPAVLAVLGGVLVAS